jgi:hypothetical protein
VSVFQSHAVAIFGAGDDNERRGTRTTRCWFSRHFVGRPLIGTEEADLPSTYPPVLPAKGGLI